MGPAVFKTVEGAKAPWRVRFPSASAKGMGDKGLAALSPICLSVNAPVHLFVQQLPGARTAAASACVRLQVAHNGRLSTLVR